MTKLAKINFPDPGRDVDHPDQRPGERTYNRQDQEQDVYIRPDPDKDPRNPHKRSQRHADKKSVWDETKDTGMSNPVDGKKENRSRQDKKNWKEHTEP